MSHEITIPAIGESITEGILARWLAGDGDWVEEGKPLYELETDKVSSEVAAEVSGRLSIAVAEGETVEVGGAIGSIDTAAQRPAVPQDAPAPAASATAAPRSTPGGDDSSASDALASDARPLAAATADQASPAAVERERAGAVPEHIGPAARRALREQGLQPGEVAATGPRGTLTKADVRHHQATPRPATAPTEAPSEARERASDDGERRRMSPLRKRIAQRLVNVQRTAAILSTFNEIDLSACMALRARHKEGFAETHGVKLGFMGFFTLACVRALQRYPLVNGRIEGDEIVIPRHVHMGIAMGTERGLVVPVLREADTLDLAGVESAIRAYAARARDGKLTIADMEGGTFTITNGGVYGSLLSTPIINPPQSGILGMHAIKDRPVAVDGQVVIRPMMYVALSYDHRIVDGAEAVGFLVRVKELIEDPPRLLLGL